MKLVFCFVLLGSSASIVFNIDNVFPFSNYPMYSRTFEPDPTLIQYTVLVEPGDGGSQSFLSGYDLSPFWGASFREALLVENDPERVREKLEAVFEWVNGRLIARKEAPYRRIRLYRHDIPWQEFVRRRLANEELRSLYVQHSKLLLEVGGEQ